MITTPFQLWTDLTKRGFRIRLVSGRPAVSPKAMLTVEDRQSLALWGNDLVKLLLPTESWDGAEAARLGHDADTLISELDVSGHHPELQDAIEMEFMAQATKNMNGVRAALSEFARVVRELAAQRYQPRSRVQRPPFVSERWKGVQDGTMSAEFRE